MKYVGVKRRIGSLKADLYRNPINTRSNAVVGKKGKSLTIFSNKKLLHWFEENTRGDFQLNIVIFNLCLYTIESYF